MIGSRLAMIAIVSAMRLPGRTTPIACRFTKLGSGPDQARDLGHDRTVGHLVKALVDHVDRLLDLVEADEIARVRIALLAGGDVEGGLGGEGGWVGRGGG